MVDIDPEEALEALKNLLPPERLLCNAEALRPYECDGLSAYRQLPIAVALPENESEIVAVLRVCHQLGVPVVPRGAGTGLSGGALPHAQGIILSTAKLTSIVRIDPERQLAVVQPGVRRLPSQCRSHSLCT